jgi:hypothetical protein
MLRLLKSLSIGFFRLLNPYNVPLRIKRGALAGGWKKT